mmetsp:Transcript_315/g.1041  ORF Transcript_315/g.1041 Transcript_315/m.1041 type:complete len:202 (-) Transcript_315:79-684(-)
MMCSMVGQLRGWMRACSVTCENWRNSLPRAKNCCKRAGSFPWREASSHFAWIVMERSPSLFKSAPPSRTRLSRSSWCWQITLSPSDWSTLRHVLGKMPPTHRCRRCCGGTRAPKPMCVDVFLSCWVSWGLRCPMVCRCLSCFHGAANIYPRKLSRLSAPMPCVRLKRLRMLCQATMKSTATKTTIVIGRLISPTTCTSLRR